MASDTLQKGTDIGTLIRNLIEFQEVNQNLDDLVEEINTMRNEMQDEEKKYDNKKMHYDKQLPLLEAVEKDFSSIESELKKIKQGIEEDEEKKKKIKTIKEFKAINKQIDEHNKNNAILENKLLSKSEELEFKREKINLIREEMKELEGLIQAKKEDLEALIRERQESISTFEADRKAIEAKLPSKLVLVFNRIYKHKDKSAVVRVSKQECHGCHLKVPFQVEVDVRKQEEIVYCTNCSRILYWEAEDDPLEDAEAGMEGIEEIEPETEPPEAEESDSPVQATS